MSRTSHRQCRATEAVAAAEPGRVAGKAVIVEIEIGVGSIEIDDFEALPRQIERERGSRRILEQVGKSPRRGAAFVAIRIIGTAIQQLFGEILESLWIEVLIRLDFINLVECLLSQIFRQLLHPISQQIEIVLDSCRVVNALQLSRKSIVPAGQLTYQISHEIKIIS